MASTRCSEARHQPTEPTVTQYELAGFAIQRRPALPSSSIHRARLGDAMPCEAIAHGEYRNP